MSSINNSPRLLLTPVSQPIHSSLPSNQVYGSMTYLTHFQSHVLSLTPWEPCWFPDYGASHHMIANPSNFALTQPYICNKSLMIGNDDSLSSNIYHNQINFIFSPNRILKMNNMLLISNIAKNLLNVSQFTKENLVFFEFHYVFGFSILVVSTFKNTI